MELHLKAPRGWINDPNGFIYYKGKYHVFYQHFPYAPRWGRMHWGHAISDDLTNWEHLDIALYPSKEFDRDGCFSGSAIEKNGKLYLYYTGVYYGQYDKENINCYANDDFVASQMMVISEDGYNFDNIENKKVVILPLEDEKIGDKKNTRDPKVWRGKDNNYYMVLGSTADNEGRLLFYRSKDLENFEYVNFARLEKEEAVLNQETNEKEEVCKGDINNKTKNNTYGWMWECPDYFEVNGKGVLIFSPIGIEEGCQAICTLVDFDEETCTMSITNDYQYFDLGLDLYAPQSNLDKDGNRVVIAWLRMPRVMDDNTIGLFSIPRICEVKNNHIYFKPHENVRKLFTKEAKELLDCCRIDVNLSEGEEINIGGYVISRKNGKIYTDRTDVTAGIEDIKKCFETPKLNCGKSVNLEIYFEKNIIEVFINYGEYVITNAVYGMSHDIKATENVEYHVRELEADI